MGVLDSDEISSIETESLGVEVTEVPNEQKDVGYNDDVEDIDPRLLSAMMIALKERNDVEGIDDTSLMAVCVEAAKLGVINNADWLTNKLASIRPAGAEGSQQSASSVVKEEVVAPTITPGLQDPIGMSVESSEVKVEAEDKKESFDEVPLSKPAVIDSPEDLIPILAAHLEWIESVVDPKKPIQGGRANLVGCCLSGFDLAGVDLRGANLQEADLSDANLFQANLSTANLANANLTNTNLTEAKLKRSFLRGANFEGTKLEGVDFRWADYHPNQLSQEQKDILLPKSDEKDATS